MIMIIINVIIIIIVDHSPMVSSSSSFDDIDILSAQQANVGSPAPVVFLLIAIPSSLLSLFIIAYHCPLGSLLTSSVHITTSQNGVWGPLHL